MIGGTSLIQDVPQDIPNVIRYEDLCDTALIGHGSPAVCAPERLMAVLQEIVAD
jgi:hypothetical protein